MLNDGLHHLLGLLGTLGLGSDLKEAVALLGVGRHGRIRHGVHLVAEYLIHRTFGHAENVNCVRDYLLVGKRAQIRHRAGAEHRVALLRRAGQHEDYRAVLGLERAAGSRAPIIVENRTADREHGLLEIILGHLLTVAAVCQIIVQACLLVLVHLKLEPEGLCEDLLCQIVAGRAEAAGGYDDIRPFARDLDAVGKALRVIADYGVVLDVYSYLREHEGYIPCVGVRRVAEEYLRSDGEYLDIICLFQVYSPTFILSIPAYASSTSASISSADSICSTSRSLGFVLGCLGVKTVQQSSYGRIDVSKVPILRARRTISSLSMPMSGWRTGRSVTACVEAMASMVWLAT